MHLALEQCRVGSVMGTVPSGMVWVGSSFHLSRQLMSAILTNLPFSTWRKYAARGSSSTSGSISLTLGRGWRTAMSFLASDMRRASSMKLSLTLSNSSSSRKRSFCTLVI